MYWRTTSFRKVRLSAAYALFTRCQGRLSFATAQKLIKQVMPILRKEPNVVYLTAPTYGTLTFWAETKLFWYLSKVGSIAFFFNPCSSVWGHSWTIFWFASFVEELQLSWRYTVSIFGWYGHLSRTCISVANSVAKIMLIVAASRRRWSSICMRWKFATQIVYIC